MRLYHKARLAESPVHRLNPGGTSLSGRATLLPISVPERPARFALDANPLDSVGRIGREQPGIAYSVTISLPAQRQRDFVTAKASYTQSVN